MKKRTFTVLITEEYDEANGVEMTDAEAVAELRGNLQAACDDSYIGQNFLITNVEDGTDGFWKKWKEAIDNQTFKV